MDLAVARDRHLLWGTRVDTTGASGELDVAGELMFCAPAEGAGTAVLYRHRQAPGGEPRNRYFADRGEAMN